MSKQIYALSQFKAQLTSAAEGKDYLSYPYTDEINNIIELHPDEIWLNCFEEMEVHCIFRNFIEGIRDWCVTHNRKIIVHMPSAWEKRLLDDPILDVRGTYGYHLIMYAYNKYDYKHISQTDWTYLFTCYNRRMDNHRTELIKELHKANLFDEGIVTYKIDDQHQFTDPYLTILKDLPLIDPLEPDYEIYKTEDMMPCAIAPSYRSALIDLVTESRYITKDEFFFTEKTNKPLMTLKPFLVMSNQGFHKRLKDVYGIEPYTEIFDYSFDDEPDYKLRAKGIVQNVIRLHDRFPTPESRKEVWLKLQDKLLANKEAHETYILSKEKMTPEAFKIFDRLGDCELYGDWEPSIGRYLHHAQSCGWIQSDTTEYFIKASASHNVSGQ
jgi:hypothetical protein